MSLLLPAILPFAVSSSGDVDRALFLSPLSKDSSFHNGLFPRVLQQGHVVVNRLTEQCREEMVWFAGNLPASRLINEHLVSLGRKCDRHFSEMCSFAVRRICVFCSLAVGEFHAARPPIDALAARKKGARPDAWTSWPALARRKISLLRIERV